MLAVCWVVVMVFGLRVAMALLDNDAPRFVLRPPLVLVEEAALPYGMPSSVALEARSRLLLFDVVMSVVS